MADMAETAVANLREATGLETNWQYKDQERGVLILYLKNNRKVILDTVVKTHLRMHQIDEVLAKYKPDLIIAQKIYAKEKGYLRDKGFGFLEENGNIELKKDELFLFIDKKRPTKKTKEQGNRAFTKTGLKVVFQLLQDKILINRTQREIAERAGVALGNIPLVIQGLLDTNYLLKLNTKEYLWENKTGLLKRFMEAYETTLKLQLYIGTFKIKVNWQDIDLYKAKTVWGGEPAADLLTNHLRPEKMTLYTQETKNEIIKHYRMLPDEKGEVKVYKMFWKQDETQRTAPPLLVYTDLLIEGGKRNLETAEKIYNEYIEPNI